MSDGDENIVQNPTFDDGLNNWSGRGCKIVVHDSMADGKVLPMSGKFFASTADRTQNWNGIQQEITGRVQRKLAYEVVATLRILGNNITSANVRATLWVQAANLPEQYIGIGRLVLSYCQHSNADIFSSFGLELTYLKVEMAFFKQDAVIVNIKSVHSFIPFKVLVNLVSYLLARS